MFISQSENLILTYKLIIYKSITGTGKIELLGVIDKVVQVRDSQR